MLPRIILSFIFSQKNFCRCICTWRTRPKSRPYRIPCSSMVPESSGQVPPQRTFSELNPIVFCHVINRRTQFTPENSRQTDAPVRLPAAVSLGLQFVGNVPSADDSDDDEQPESSWSLRKHVQPLLAVSTELQQLLRELSVQNALLTTTQPFYQKLSQIK